MNLLGWFVAFQWLMTAAFTFSAAVQYNDPDPLPWMAIYGTAAAASAWAALKARGYPWALSALVGAVALVWGLSLLPQVVGKVRLPELFASWEMRSPRVEVAREAGGLLIVAAWMAVTTLVRLRMRG